MFYLRKGDCIGIGIRSTSLGSNAEGVHLGTVALRNAHEGDHQKERLALFFELAKHA